MSDVKECPSCGRSGFFGIHDLGYVVLCRSIDCGCSSGVFPTRGMALAAWNKRATPHAPLAEPSETPDAEWHGC